MAFTLICHRCDVFGIHLTTLGHVGLLMHTRTHHCTEKVCWNQHSSEGPHVKLENVFDELSVECHLAQRQCVPACDALRVVSLSSLKHLRDCVILMTEWVCRWKRLWIPSGDTFQKAYLEEWERVTANKAMSSVKTRHTGSPELQNRKSYRRPGKTSGTHLHDLRGLPAGQGERRRVWMGVTRCHIKGIFSPATARWQIVLHSDVVAHQQQLCQKARHRKKLLLTFAL